MLVVKIILIVLTATFGIIGGIAVILSYRCGFAAFDKPSIHEDKVRCIWMWILEIGFVIPALPATGLYIVSSVIYKLVTGKDLDED